MEDAPAIFSYYAQDPEVTRFLFWSPHRSIRDTEEFLQLCQDAWRDGDRFPWAITRALDGGFLGMIEARLEGHSVNVGYVLARAEWGKGYGTEALRAVVDFAFSFPTVYRVWAVCDVENRASARIMEKAGMVREGLLRRHSVLPNLSAEPRDVYLHARTK